MKTGKSILLLGIGLFCSVSAKGMGLALGDIRTEITYSTSTEFQGPLSVGGQCFAVTGLQGEATYTPQTTIDIIDIGVELPFQWFQNLVAQILNPALHLPVQGFVPPCKKGELHAELTLKTATARSFYDFGLFELSFGSVTVIGLESAIGIITNLTTITDCPCPPGKIYNRLTCACDDPTAIDLNSLSAQSSAFGSTIITWETATEIDNSGFNVYRSADERGPYVKVNAALIPAKGRDISGATYTYLDEPGHGTFFYKLEDVDLRGTSTLHGPVGSISTARTKITQRPSGESELTFPIDKGWDYTVLYRDELATGSSWQPLAGAPHNSGKVIDSTAGGVKQRFYRVLGNKR